MHARHDTSHGAVVARRGITCALAALLTLVEPATGGLGIALAEPAAASTDGTGVVLVSQNAPEFWPEPKVMRITRNKVLIDELKALGIALRDLGLKQEDVDEIEVELDCDETASIFEVELHVGDIEHEYKIEPYTGEIMSHTREWEGDSPCPIITRKK